MPGNRRNELQIGDWVLSILETNEDFDALKQFDCGHNELNEFFCEDARVYKEELLATIYSLRSIETSNKNLSPPVAYVSFNNDSIHLYEKQRIRIFPPKQATSHKFFPAVKIGRLGVIKSLQGQNVGTHLLNIIKQLFLTNNRTGCRFITIDALNEDLILRFYEKNHFQYLHNKDKKSGTRIMYFDLKRQKDTKI
jgi:GNAT superfamily N-acetyltransferase